MGVYSNRETLIGFRSIFLGGGVSSGGLLIVIHVHVIPYPGRGVNIMLRVMTLFLSPYMIIIHPYHLISTNSPRV